MGRAIQEFKIPTKYFNLLFSNIVYSFNFMNSTVHEQMLPHHLMWKEEGCTGTEIFVSIILQNMLMSQCSVLFFWQNKLEFMQ